MRFLFILTASLLALAATAQKKLVIIGSSTSACVNVAPASCYVTLLDAFYNQSLPADTTVSSIAAPGTNVYQGMPSSYIPPYPQPNYQPAGGNNITNALNSNANVVIVNYPTNEYDHLPLDSILYCLRTIRDSANIKGVPCFVTTTQPRTSGAFGTSIIKAKLAELKDSILLEFGAFAIDFYTGLINPADSSILYDSGDGIHMNATGHQELYQRVLAKNIFLATLPATFLQFNTQSRNNSNIISWLTAKETDVAYYEVQRSADGTIFTRIATVPASNAPGNRQYSYSDDQPLKSWNYYKILIVDKDGRKHASPVMSVRNSNDKLSFTKVFATSFDQVTVELQNNEAQQVHLQIFNSMGKLVSAIDRRINPGGNTLYLQTPSLSNGVYHVRLTGEKGETLIKSFLKN